MRRLTVILEADSVKNLLSCVVIQGAFTKFVELGSIT